MKEREPQKIGKQEEDSQELLRTLKQIQSLLYELDPSVFDTKHRWVRLRRSFSHGLLRGLGTAIGFSVLGALAIMLLTHLASQNIPVIGNFIAEIIKIVNQISR